MFPKKKNAEHSQSIDPGQSTATASGGKSLFANSMGSSKSFDIDFGFNQFGSHPQPPASVPSPPAENPAPQPQASPPAEPTVSFEDTLSHTAQADPMEGQHPLMQAQPISESAASPMAGQHPQQPEPHPLMQAQAMPEPTPMEAQHLQQPEPHPLMQAQAPAQEMTVDSVPPEFYTGYNTHQPQTPPSFEEPQAHAAPYIEPSTYANTGGVIDDFYAHTSPGFEDTADSGLPPQQEEVITRPSSFLSNVALEIHEDEPMMPASQGLPSPYPEQPHPLQPSAPVAYTPEPLPPVAQTPLPRVEPPAQQPAVHPSGTTDILDLSHWQAEANPNEEPEYASDHDWSTAALPDSFPAFDASDFGAPDPLLMQDPLSDMSSMSMPSPPAPPPITPPQAPNPTLGQDQDYSNIYADLSIEMPVEPESQGPANSTSLDMLPTALSPETWRLEDLNIKEIYPLDGNRNLLFVEVHGTYGLMGLVETHISAIKVFSHNVLTENTLQITPLKPSEIYQINLGNWQGVLHVQGNSLKLLTEFGNVV